MSEVAHNLDCLRHGLRNAAFLLLIAMVSFATPCAESMLARGAQCESAAEEANEWLALARSIRCRPDGHRNWCPPRLRDSGVTNQVARCHAGLSLFPGHRLSNGILAPLRR